MELVNINLRLNEQLQKREKWRALHLTPNSFNVSLEHAAKTIDATTKVLEMAKQILNKKESHGS